MINIYFTKTVLLWFSFISFIFTITNKSDATTIVSTSVPALVGSIISLCDKNFQKSHWAFKIIKYLVRIQFIFMIALILLELQLRLFLEVDIAKMIIKTTVGTFLFITTLGLSFLRGDVDTKEDEKIKRTCHRLVKTKDKKNSERQTQERAKHYNQPRKYNIAKKSKKGGRNKK